MGFCMSTFAREDFLPNQAWKWQIRTSPSLNGLISTKPVNVAASVPQNFPSPQPDELPDEHV